MLTGTEAAGKDANKQEREYAVQEKSEDGTNGFGVVGFQSFVRRSGWTQSYEMEGSALEQRLKLGRVAFYGAFQMLENTRREHVIM
jgi:hypothetical protein